MYSRYCGEYTVNGLVNIHNHTEPDKEYLNPHNSHISVISYSTTSGFGIGNCYQQPQTPSPVNILTADAYNQKLDLSMKKLLMK